jgi:two-component system chemotaxis response regulator CheB
MKPQKRVLIIDDDDSIRIAIGSILRTNGYTVDTARTGREGIEKSNLNTYDLALIDHRLPDLEGTRLLTELQSTTPGMVKIMMTGSPSPENRTEAFDRYADAYIVKPVKIDDLLETVKERLTEQDEWRQEIDQETLRRHEGQFAVVAIGASAGGPAALERVLSRLPSQLPAAILVSQHIPSGFTKPLAERLEAVSSLHIKEAHDSDVLKTGNVFITPSGHNMVVEKSGRIHLQETQQTPSPSIDAMMKSAAVAYGPRCVGVLLTGMLTDGVLGMKAIKDHGGVTIAQDESSSLVFGMNKAAIDSGAVDIVAHISIMPSRIVNAVIECDAARKTGRLNPTT